MNMTREQFNIVRKKLNLLTKLINIIKDAFYNEDCDLTEEQVIDELNNAINEYENGDEVDG